MSLSLHRVEPWACVLRFQEPPPGPLSLPSSILGFQEPGEASSPGVKTAPRGPVGKLWTNALSKQTSQNRNKGTQQCYRLANLGALWTLPSLHFWHSDLLPTLLAEITPF